MPHIHTEPNQYDQTASAFIFRYVEGEAKILLIPHKILNLLLQPGGHVELHENPWEAVLHEVEEETGYELSQLEILQPDYVFEVPFKNLVNGVAHPAAVMQNSHVFGSLTDQHMHTDTVYAFTTLEAPQGLPGADESKDLQWFTEEELSQLSDDEIMPDIRTIGLTIFNYHLETWVPCSFNKEGVIL